VFPPSCDFTASTLVGYYSLQDIKNYKSLMASFGMVYFPSFVKIRLLFQKLMLEKAKGT
jgi:hypothetical protein